MRPAEIGAALARRPYSLRECGNKSAIRRRRERKMGSINSRLDTAIIGYYCDFVTISVNVKTIHPLLA